MGGRTFECLDAVINRYRKEQIVEGHTLVQPVCRVSVPPSTLSATITTLTRQTLFLLFIYLLIKQVSINILFLYFKALSDTEAIKSQEVQHAEKIYATLRECREQSGLKKNKG
jgi:Ras GTPase-activating protein 1